MEREIIVGMKSRDIRRWKEKGRWEGREPAGMLREEWWKLDVKIKYWL